ncbi:MAG: hypothetical protein PHO42_03615 [Candidatus Omnitrophica bacterium]|nr:hypothetical protein [Candidatus Omnitrophota bacterium]
MIFGLLGCAPTFPKEKVQEGIVNLCSKEYKVSVDTKIVGSTLAVYLPVENLFDAVLNLDEAASKKINDVILGVSRVSLSTDAKFDFYVVIAQDPRMADVEIVYIRYVDDVKRFLLGDISREQYSNRAVIMLKTPPQAERERILKDLFSKLNIENSDEMIREYLEAEEDVSGIGEISYWHNKFYIKEITMPEFLTSLIEERIRVEFRVNKDLNKWYEFKGCKGRFVKGISRNRFAFRLEMANRVEPLYLESGAELDAYKKKSVVFGRLFAVAADVLWAYRFNDFEKVEFYTPISDLRTGRDKLWRFRKGKVKIEELI